MASRIGVVFLAALTLSGCAIFGGPADRALRRTPSYREGYSDGCAAATERNANPRDTQDSLKGEDRVYRRGFAGGLQACRSTTVAPGDAPHIGSPTGGAVRIPG